MDNLLLEKIPLAFAKVISKKAKVLLRDDESFDEIVFEKLTPVSKGLVEYWFWDEYAKEREEVEFHVGQKEAIINMIYLFEVQRDKRLAELYIEFKDDIKQSYKE